MSDATPQPVVVAAAVPAELTTTAAATATTTATATAAVGEGARSAGTARDETPTTATLRAGGSDATGPAGSAGVIAASFVGGVLATLGSLLVLSRLRPRGEHANGVGSWLMEGHADADRAFHEFAGK